MQNLSNESKFVVNVFIQNKIQSITFKGDTKLTKKLAGIQTAINEGYLFTKPIADSEDISVKATSKLMKLYYPDKKK